MDCRSPGSSIHGIFQARVQEWVAIAFSILSIMMLKFILFLHVSVVCSLLFLTSMLS